MPLPSVSESESPAGDALADLERSLRRYATESLPGWCRATAFVRSDRGETLEVLIRPDPAVTS